LVDTSRNLFLLCELWRLLLHVKLSQRLVQVAHRQAMLNGSFAQQLALPGAQGSLATLLHYVADEAIAKHGVGQHGLTMADLDEPLQG
jgi:hypothetical protein